MRVFRLLKIMTLSMCLISFPVLGFWAGWHARECKRAADYSRSRCGFNQIRSLLFSYHDRHGTFPPITYQPQANGPMHSWRVMVVQDGDSEYDFAQEWNSPKNLRALSGMPSYFTKDPAGVTEFLAIGDGDDWPSQDPLRSLLVTKGKDRFLVVEYPDSDIHWMEPKY